MKLIPSDITEDKSVFDLYPVFKTYPECKARVGIIEPSTLLHYVLLVYSKESDLASEKDLQKLKDAAARRVGWRKNKKGEYPESIDRIISGNEPIVNRMIFRVFVMQQDLEWAGYKADQATYWQLISELNSSLDDDADVDKKLKSVEYKLKLSDGKELLLKRINTAHHNMFKGDKELEAAVVDNDLAASDYGEGIAERMAKETLVKK